MLGCKTIENPVEENKKLEESDESSLFDKGKYLPCLPNIKPIKINSRIIHNIENWS
jgi:hypothetical protein